MRLARLCEKKAKTGKCHVDDSVHRQWKAGGEAREWLEIALAESLDKLGYAEMGKHKKVRAASLQRCTVMFLFHFSLI